VTQVSSNVLEQKPNSPREFLLHNDPEKAFRKQIITLDTIRNEYSQEEYVRQVAHLCKTDLWFLMRHALGFHYLDSDFHGRKFVRHYARAIHGGSDGHGRDLLTLASRGHCKTTILACFLIQEILNWPTIAIGIISGTEKLARYIAKMIADALMFNPVLQQCFPDILPNANNPARNWGIRGYYLPRVDSRLDPTIAVGSISSNLTGTHPDIMVFEDIVWSKNPTDLEKAEQAFIESLPILPPHGKIIVNGTRWHDADLYGKIVDGRFEGNRGKFVIMREGCFVDPKAEVLEAVYPSKRRGGMITESGFRVEDLLRKKKNDRLMFACQYLNEPMPEEDVVLRKDDLQVYEDDGTLPTYTKVEMVGIETVGPSVVFPELFRQACAEYGASIPVREFRPVKGAGKIERIMSTLNPLVSNKKVFVRPWMKNERNQLGEEMERLGVARHDDIVDALHMVPASMTGGTTPNESKPAQAYIVADLAFSRTVDSDFTVYMAVAVDHHNNHWVIDYERMQETNPMTLATRLIKFYQRINSKAIDPGYNRSGRRWSLGRSYT
jgi:hypothetical protein